MRLLLDTHVLLWWLANDPSLGEEAREGMAVCDAVNIAAVLRGELPPPNVVPEQRGMLFR